MLNKVMLRILLIVALVFAPLATNTTNKFALANTEVAAISVKYKGANTASSLDLEKGKDINIDIILEPKTNINYAVIIANLTFDNSHLQYKSSSVDSKSENLITAVDNVVKIQTTPKDVYDFAINTPTTIATITFRVLETFTLENQLSLTFDSGKGVLNGENTPINVGIKNLNIIVEQPNPNLTNLTLRGVRSNIAYSLNIPFEQTTKNYEVTIKYQDRNAISVTTAKLDSRSTVTVGNNTNLSTGSIITITSKLGGETVVYSILVTVEEPANNIFLDVIEVSDELEIAEFNPEKLEYEIQVSTETASLAFKPVVSSGINYTSLKVNEKTVANGQFSDYIALRVGENIISVIIVAEDGVSETEYKIKVLRADFPREDEDKKPVIEDKDSPEEFKIDIIDIISWSVIGVLLITQLITVISLAKNKKALKKLKNN